ncbi:MAG: hypothetical protein WBB85_11025 [Albidovulum sp.]|uniref:hypothetical protein n=1 Tax=Albidovulum sp. TaxID=1872424 RepID=UPI003CB57FD3
MRISPLNKLPDQLSATELEELQKIDDAEYRKVDEQAPGPEWNWLQPMPIQAATAGLVSMAPDGVRHQTSTLREIESDHAQETTKRQELAEDPATKADLDRERKFRELVELYMQANDPSAEETAGASQDAMQVSVITEADDVDNSDARHDNEASEIAAD